MQTDLDENLDEGLLSDIIAFETFLKRIGFKRVEGAVLGLLVLSENPQTSEEIEKTLNLSQSAVSMALKTLGHYGAIETRESREKRIKLHHAKEDSLSIVATVFKKREQEAIEDFKASTTKILEKAKKKGGPNSLRVKRLLSIVSTCEISEAVMSFIIGLAGKTQGPLYDEIVRRLPSVLNIATLAGKPIDQTAETIKSALASKLKDGISKIAGEING